MIVGLVTGFCLALVVIMSFAFYLGHKVANFVQSSWKEVLVFYLEQEYEKKYELLVKLSEADVSLPPAIKNEKFN